MKPADLAAKWDRPIGYNRAFVSLGVGATGALMLTQAVYWHRRTKKAADGWFYKTVSEWEDETGLTRHEQETARRRLRDLGVLEEDLRGVPCRTYFRVRIDVIDALFEGGQTSLQFAGIQQTGLPESGKLDCRIPASMPAGNRQTITGITRKEITPGITSKSGAPSSVPIGAFPMSLDWKPDRDVWALYATRAGITDADLTAEALIEFTGHWHADGAAHTEAQWITKLVARLKRAREFAARDRGTPTSRPKKTQPPANTPDYRAGLNGTGALPP